MVQVEFVDGTKEEIKEAEEWYYSYRTGLFSIVLKNGRKIAYPREVVKSIRYVEGEND